MLCTPSLSTGMQKRFTEESVKRLVISEILSTVAMLRLQRPGKVCWTSVSPDIHLHVRIAADGSSSYYYRRKNPPVVRSLGKVLEVDLQDVEMRCHELEAKVMRGEVIPKMTQAAPLTAHAKVAGKQAELAQKSLGELMIDWFPLEASTGRWKMTTRNAETKFMGGVRNHLAPRLPMPLKDLTPYLLESALTAIFKQHREIAKGLRAWVCSYLKWAEDEGILENGRWMAAQVRQDLTELWRRQKHKKRLHRAALSYEKAPLFYAELDTVAGTAAQACKVAILTCTRTSSVLHMRWKDIDFKEKVWICPAEFMKESGNGAHIVYLSKQAVKAIQSMPRVLSGGKRAEWVFSTARGERICSDLCKVIESMNARRIGRGLEPWLDFSQTDPKTGKHPRVTVHGFRATFKTWTRSEVLGNWKKYDATAVELCLHHVPDDHYDGAYDREDFPDMQRQILQDWADCLESSTGPVLAS